MKFSYILILFPFFFSPIAIFAQFIAVNFDVEKNYFNEGQPLPSEKALMFTGVIPEDVNILEIKILHPKAKHEKDALYTAYWKNTTNNNSGNYSLAVNYKLRASEEYDFQFRYFKSLREDERQALTERIIQQINAYLDASILLEKKQIELVKRDKKMLAEMQLLVNDLLSNYQNLSVAEFEGFSLSVQQKLENLDKLDSPNQKKDSSAMKNDAFLDLQMRTLYDQIAREIELYMDKSWSILSSSYYVDNYATEDKRGVFSVNAGYGGVYLSGNLDDLTYGASPYFGLSFPLSNSTLAPRFLRNSSITIGAFIDNFENESGNEVTGFVVNRPIYLGLDYKLFQFIRFNAGATLLESATQDTNGIPSANAGDRDVFIRPFIGLSAKIDLSVGFGK